VSKCVWAVIVSAKNPIFVSAKYYSSQNEKGLIFVSAKSISTYIIEMGNSKWFSNYNFDR